MADRLAAVTSVIYLAFTAGYAPTSGSDATRVELAGEAIRLARLLRGLLPRPELDALLALMLLQHSRRDARTDESGQLVLLPEQDRSRWRYDEIGEGLDLLEGLPAGQRRRVPAAGLDRRRTRDGARRAGQPDGTGSPTSTRNWSS